MTKFYGLAECEICHEIFEKATSNAKYCCDACRRQAHEEKEADYRARAYARQKYKRQMKGLHLSRCSEIEAEQRKAGKSYADYQKEKTLQALKEGKL